MKLYRPDSGLSLYEFGMITGLELREMWAMSTINCIQDSYKSNCQTNIVEFPNQRKNSLSRIGIKRRIAMAEQMIANYLGYWPYPKYIEGETHTIRHMTDYIRTKFSNVLITGTENFRQVAIGLPITREFVDPDGFGFPTCIRWTIGTLAQPILDLDANYLDRLRIYPSDFDLKHGHRLRPFEVESFVNGVLVITMPTWIAAKRNLYMSYPVQNNLLIDLDACDEDIYIEDLLFYIPEYLEPSGYMTLRDKLCDCVDDQCAACARVRIPICLVPIDASDGLFEVRPMINTSDFDEAPCWEAVEFSTYQNHYNNSHCCTNQCSIVSCSFDRFCSLPLNVCINYVSGCPDCYESCFADEVCDQFKEAVAFLAAGLLPFVCDCPACTIAGLEYYHEDIRKISSGNSAAILRLVYKNSNFRFGYTEGAVLAMSMLKDMEKRHEYVIL